MNMKDSMSHYAKKGEKREQELIKYEFIPLSAIDLNPDNVFAVTDTEEEIAEFAEKLKAENGTLHNIVVKPNGEGRYMIISGERRVRAYKLLKKETIFAQIRPEGSWIDDFKLICCANTDTRKYTNERCDNIVREIKEKLAKYCPDENNRKTLLSMVQGAFGVSQVQAYKYINVSEDLIDSLKQLYFEEVFGINEAVLYSGLTQEAQDRIYEIYGEYDNAKEIAQNYAKKVDTILVNCKKELKRQGLKQKYANNCLNRAKEEGNEQDIKKYEDSLAAIAKMMQELLDKQSEDIKNIEITEPTVQPKKTPAEVNRDDVNKFGKILDSYEKRNGTNETIEKIRELLATLLA